MHNGILAVWSDVDPAAEDDYTAWYEREHMFERVAVPGFHRARHYVALSGAPKYFTYYVTDDAAVMASPAYLAGADDPSPWTRRVLLSFRNTNRTACNVVRRAGRGYGAACLTIRLGAAAGRAVELAAWLGDSVFPALLGEPGIVGAQLWQGDREATLVPVADRELRPGADAVADLVVFVDATTAKRLGAVAEGPLSADELAAHGAAAGGLVAIHQFLNGAEKDEAAPL
jgi:hypothetical protein